LRFVLAACPDIPPAQPVPPAGSYREAVLPEGSHRAAVPPEGSHASHRRSRSHPNEVRVLPAGSHKVPELPDIELYLHALRPRIVGQRLERVRLASPFLVRTFEPPIDAIVGHEVTAVRRLGKRIVWQLDDDLFVIFHLMIAGRFRWKENGANVPAKVGLAAFDFPFATLVLTEAGSKRQASLYVVRGEDAMRAHDPGGLEVLDATPAQFAAALRRESHTIKRALTDPHVLSGIGNAYSDEILHAAKMSPLKLTSQLTAAEYERLHELTVRTLKTWRDRLIEEPDRHVCSSPRHGVRKGGSGR